MDKYVFSFLFCTIVTDTDIQQCDKLKIHLEIIIHAKSKSIFFTKWTLINNLIARVIRGIVDTIYL